MTIASIPDVPECIASLKEDFQVSAEYSPETGKFTVEGTLEQMTCTQVRLQEILQQQLELQKHQLRRLSSRGSRNYQPGQYGGVAEHGCDWPQAGWHPPPAYNWTDSPYHGAAAAASSDYHRTASYEGKHYSVI